MKKMNHPAVWFIFFIVSAMLTMFISTKLADLAAAYNDGFWSVTTFPHGESLPKINTLIMWGFGIVIAACGSITSFIRMLISAE